MKSRNTCIIQNITIAILAAVTLTNQSLAADIVLTPPAGGGVAITNAAGNVTRLRVGEDGTVGIGTSTPQTKLHAVGTSWFQGDNTPLPAAAGKGIAIGSGGNIYYLFAFDYGNFTPQNLLLNHPGGNVGIGTPDPVSGRLHVEGGNTAGDIAVYGRSFFGKSGIEGFSQTGDGVFGESGVGNGVHGHSISGWAGYFQGKVNVTGNSCSANYPCASDVRLKENVQSLGYGLPELMRLRPVSWSWIDQTQKQLPMGLIAQDVDEVIPELVLRDADPTKPLGLNYMGLLPVMIKAMQEQQDIITALDARVKVLEQSLQQSRTQR